MQVRYIHAGIRTLATITKTNQVAIKVVEQGVVHAPFPFVIAVPIVVPPSYDILVGDYKSVGGDVAL